MSEAVTLYIWVLLTRWEWGSTSAPCLDPIQKWQEKFA